MRKYGNNTNEHHVIRKILSINMVRYRNIRRLKYVWTVYGIILMYIKYMNSVITTNTGEWKMKTCCANPT